MEGTLNNLKKAAAAVIEEQNKSKADLAMIVLADVEGKHMRLEVVNGNGFSLAALLAQVLVEDEFLLNAVKLAVAYVEDQKKED